MAILVWRDLLLAPAEEHHFTCVIFLNYVQLKTKIITFKFL